MNNDDMTTQDPAAIERDIRRTQEDMSRTVDKIGDQLSIKNVFNALLDKADENGVDAHYMLDGARRNPMALGLIAAGAIWLISDKDSKFPSLSSGGKSAGGKFGHSDSDSFGIGGEDIHHRDYVSHMSSFEPRDGEDDASLQRRRDLHRANFLMCERNPDEDDHSFRQRLNELTDKFREKRSAWMDSVSQAGSATGDKAQAAAGWVGDTAQQASGRAQDMYNGNPLVGGILAAAVGAALGSTIPVSRQEQEKLGGIGAKARDMASEQTDQLTEKAMEKKDELLEKADQKLQSAQGSGGQQGQSSGGQSPQGQSPQQRTSQPALQPAGGSGQPSGTEPRSGSDSPFIISERKN